MSRAGLGKKMTLIDKWLKKPVFCRVLEELDDFDSFCELYISAASGLRVQPGGDGGGSDEHAVGSGGSAVNSPLRLAFQEFDADGDGALSLDGAHCVAASRRPHARGEKPATAATDAFVAAALAWMAAQSCAMPWRPWAMLSLAV